MTTLQHLFKNNRAWATHMTEQDPHFFETLAAQQSPEYLEIYRTITFDCLVQMLQVQVRAMSD